MIKKHRFTTEFLKFLSASPTSFHAVSNIAAILRENGYERLQEQQEWRLNAGNRYFFIREDGALIAFHLLSDDWTKEGFRILGAHSDSPCLQIKPRPDINSRKYHQLGVEIYGGALLHSWFDRDLSLAGRVCCRMQDGSLITLLVDFRRPILSIPSLAIHLDREVNKTRDLNAQQHLTPIFSQISNGSPPEFKSLLLQQVAKEHPHMDVTEVFGFDIFCYDTQPPCRFGLHNEFISAGRLDNLLSCFAGLQSMLATQGNANCMFICNNHEETGSRTTTGALGSLPMTIMERLFPETIARRLCLSKSFFVSMDNAHAIHPNYQDKSEPSHQVLLNHGPVIKINANQRYATDSFSNAVYRLLAKEAKVSTQDFVMRNDMPCGSTIGPLIASRLGVRTVDVGAPTLAMHSIREITGSKDPHLLYRVAHHFLTREHLPQETEPE